MLISNESNGRVRRLVLGSCVLGAFGCGDDAKVIDQSANQLNPSGGAGATSTTPPDTTASAGSGAGAIEQQPAAEPLYVVSTTVFAGDVAQGYLVPITSIAPGTTFDLTSAIEVADNTIATRAGTPYLYVGSSEEPTVTRWELGADGQLATGPSVSFANLGLSRASVSDELMFSDTQAYMPDDDNHQVVVWNPTSMEIVGSIPLEVDTDGVLLPWMWVSVQADRVLVTVSWQADFSGDWSIFGDHVSVLTIDPASNTIVDRVDDPRCNYAFWGSQTSDGSSYYSPLSYYTPIRSMLGDDARGVASCALRVNPGATDFDAAYDLDLSALAGGRPAGNLFFVSDDVALIRAWHSDLVTPISEDKANWVDVINEAGFMWWRWQVGSDAAEVLPDQTPSASETTGVYRVDGKAFIPRASADYSSTTLDEVDANGDFHPTLSGPGNIWGIARLR